MSRFRVGLVAGAVIGVLIVAAVLIVTRVPDDGYIEPAPAERAPSAEIIEQGRILAHVANCRACHTARGGEPFAGGREIPTPFGTFYSPNITPDAENGIGNWSERDFWRALHLGVSRNGAPLYPAFPYPSYTKLTQQDARAIFAYLKTIQPVPRRSQQHELRFPYNQRSLLHVWRSLYFSPGKFQLDPTQSPEWSRGSYLVNVVAHCDYCHVPRNSLGAPRNDADGPAGGEVLGWYAPALDRPDEAGLQHWTVDSIVELLQAGRTAGNPSQAGATLGPMAEIVFESLQHAPRSDIQAMATYLRSLPEGASQSPPPRNQFSERARTATLNRGKALYEDRCAKCHGDSGEGRPPAALALANNRSVTLNPPVNTIRMVLYGGYPPGTAGNPRPFGMPPFSQDLSDTQVADVVNFIRNAWGNTGSFVTADDVMRARTGPLW